jgi:GT2 family glycosyltransferase
MTRISLNVIVYNEEARLEECLADARPWVDEIVVVDQMSTDRTPEIAERLADVHVLDVHHGHAEPSRELAASRSAGDWLLILDADERMSDRLKAELRNLVEDTADGYWVRKVNYVGGIDTGTIHHYRLVRTSRVRFDPGPHGGAQALSDNVETLDWIGIVHEKTVEEQIYDDARYERIALEDVSPTSQKRNWLSHNLTLREQRAGRRRTDLERLLPTDAERVLVVGDVRIERAGIVTRADGVVDAAVVALPDDDPLGALRAIARQVRPGGVVVGTATAARNRRHLEASIAAVVGDEPGAVELARGGTTRRALLDTMSAAGLDARWTGLVRDGWLDPLALRPDGSGSIVESAEFLLRTVPAAVAEELTAEEIVFAATVRAEVADLSCSVVVASVAGAEPQRFADALAATSPETDHEIVVARDADGDTAAARWNAGARAASGDVVVFVTADATPRAGWLDALVGTHRSRPDAGATGSKVVAWDGTIWHAGLVLGPDRIPYRVYEGEPERAPHVNRPRLVPAVAGEGMAVTRDRFVEVGGFDETLAEDLTDADLCLRLRARGLPIAYAPAAVLASPRRAEPGTRDDFHRTAKEFTARWSALRVRSDGVVCSADGTDADVEWNRSWRLPRPTATAASAAEPGDLPAVAWTSHFLERGGYTEEAIAAMEALDDAGLRVVASPVALDGRASAMPAQQAARLADFLRRDLPEDFVHVAHIGANRFKRHPAAMRNVGRTMFETDRLPDDWRDQCNLMDEVWVPSDHNLRTFARAGVEVSKLHKIPETFDSALFQPDVEPLPVEDTKGFVFLSMFSWLPRKGWDVLLRAWCAEFDRHDDVTLVL